MASKYIILYQSKKIFGLNEKVVNLGNHIFAFALLLHLLFGIWMYTGAFPK